MGSRGRKRSMPPSIPCSRESAPPPPPASKLLADVGKGGVKKPFKRGIQNSSFLQLLSSPSSSKPPCLLLPLHLSILLPKSPLQEVFPFPSLSTCLACPRSPPRRTHLLPRAPSHGTGVINQIPAISPELPASDAAAGILPHQVAQESFRAVIPPSLPRYRGLRR